MDSHAEDGSPTSSPTFFSPITPASSPPVVFTDPILSAYSTPKTPAHVFDINESQGVIATNTPDVSDSDLSPHDTVNLDTSVLPTPERNLLAKLEEANRKIESDAKSAILQPSHSRKGSNASQLSLASATSSSHETETRSSGVLDEEDLWSTWAKIVTNWETEWKKRNQFVRDLVRQGIPHHFRGIAWQLLSGAATSHDKIAYASYIKANSACEKVIRRDIARTYPELDFFKEKDGLGQESLFNVMKAYSLHDREVGYCQGSCFLVGLLLMQMPEEETFAVLVQIMQQHRMREMYKPSMAELGLCMFQLENLVQELLPDLHAHFQSQNFNTSIYASSWFLTLFTTTLSQPLACRIMDVFLSEGMEIIFKVALAMLTLGKPDLLALDMENLLKYMQKELPAKAEADPDAFMNLAYTVKFNQKKLKKYEKEYLVIKSKEQSDMALIRTLRQENKILKQRVELLEKESTALAERLVQGQVDRAEEEEESFALTREVQALRRANSEAQQQLATAHEEIRSLEMSLVNSNSQVPSLENEGAACGSKEDLACCLQKELVSARLEAAEREAVARELSAKISELETENKTLRARPVDNNVAHLQEELIAAKLREAEANLSLKELRKSFIDLLGSMNKRAQDQRQESPVPGPSNVVSDIMATPKKILRAFEGKSEEVKKLEDEFFMMKVNDLECQAETKSLRLKVMELEAQVKMANNQLRRKDEEMRSVNEELSIALQRERILVAKQREAHHKYADLQSKAKYDAMQANIRSVEAAQRIAELENEVSEYKVMNQVIATEGELRSNMDESDRERQLQDKIASLKAEVLRLRTSKAAINRKLDFEDSDDDSDT